MKKIVAMVLVITSLFTLSSSVLCCGVEENSKMAEFESTSDLETIVDKEITKEEKIEKFLSEKKNYFPKDKLEDIKSILHSLSDDELKIVFNLKFDNPASMEFISLFAGNVGVDRLMLGDTGMGTLKIILSVLTLGALGIVYTYDGAVATSPTGEKVSGLFLMQRKSAGKVTCISALITALANLSINLYDNFTVPNRTRQVNYEYLLKVIDKR